MPQRRQGDRGDDKYYVPAKLYAKRSPRHSQSLTSVRTRARRPPTNIPAAAAAPGPPRPGPPLRPSSIRSSAAGRRWPPASRPAARGRHAADADDEKRRQVYPDKAPFRRRRHQNPDAILVHQLVDDFHRASARRQHLPDLVAHLPGGRGLRLPRRHPLAFLAAHLLGDGSHFVLQAGEGVAVRPAKSGPRWPGSPCSDSSPRRRLSSRPCRVDEIVLRHACRPVRLHRLAPHVHQHGVALRCGPAPRPGPYSAARRSRSR